MNQELKEKVLKVVNSVKDKSYNIYLFTLDTKGNALASVAQNYEMVKTLNDMGYNASILYDKKDYTSVESWMGEEYAKLPHKTAEGGELKINPADVLIIPEVFFNVVKETVDVNCKKVVFVQSYDYIFELMDVNDEYLKYGVSDIITTSNEMKTLVQSYFPRNKVTVIDPLISSKFKDQNKFRQPTVAVHSREQDGTIKLVKQFYKKYPELSWILFQDIKGMSMDDVNNTLNESMFAIWMDSKSSFGTFPMECFATGTPLVALTPDLKVDWCTKKDDEGVKMIENVVWSMNTLGIVDAVQDMCNVCLAENIPTELIEEMKGSADYFKSVDRYGNQIKAFLDDIDENRLEVYEKRLKNEEEVNG